MGEHGSNPQSSPLSNAIGALRRRYGVIVIGSGYGGAISAARLAQAGHDVCVLERGKEWPSGEFPEDGESVAREVKTHDNPLGLYEYVRGDDVDVLSGNGLGGTSLINANVAIKPADSVFRDPRWPAAIRDGSDDLEPHYNAVAAMLQLAEARPPCDSDLAKVAAHARSSVGRPGSFQRLQLAVNFDRYDNQPNHVGVTQSPCTLCGNCVTGCNYRAKNTLPMSYLPLARSHGAEIYCQVEVDFLLPAGDRGYHVFVTYRPERGEPVPQVLHARVVIVAAGVLGTSGILLRSRARGLALPPGLGSCFSGNGDLLGIGYNNDIRTNAVGLDEPDGCASDGAVGPTIMSMLDYRHRESRDEQFIIEEGAIPRALVRALRRVMPKAALFDGDDTDTGFRDKAKELARVVRDLVRDDPGGALNHSMIYLGIGHDGADGRIVLGHDGNARLLWGSAPDRGNFAKLSDEMRALVAELGGTYIPNPRGSELLGDNEVTVHPLGGCPMADDSRSGVVNDRGQVFDPNAASADGIHPGLYVADGSIIPTSLGVNPFFTIGALAERIAERFNAEHPDPIAPIAADIPAPPVAPLPIGLEFTEHMRGFCTPSVVDASSPGEFASAEQLAKWEGGREFHFRLTIMTEALEAFLISPQREADAVGYVAACMLGGRRQVSGGRFQLFVDHGARKLMRYRLRFTDEDGERYLLDGHKIIHDDPGIDAFEDLTTLYTTIRQGWSADGPVVAQGILRVHFGDFLEQLTTFRIRHLGDQEDAWPWLARFGAFFFGELWESYVKPQWDQDAYRAA